MVFYIKFQITVFGVKLQIVVQLIVRIVFGIRCWEMLLNVLESFVINMCIFCVMMKIVIVKEKLVCRMYIVQCILFVIVCMVLILKESRMVLKKMVIIIVVEMMLLWKMFSQFGNLRFLMFFFFLLRNGVILQVIYDVNCCW